jgi:hypothetical protein
MTPVLLLRIALKILTLALLLLALTSAAAQQPGPKISTPDEIKAEFAVQENKERLVSVQALFARLGATEETAKVEKFNAADNFVVRNRLCERLLRHPTRRPTQDSFLSGSSNPQPGLHSL